MTPRIKVFLSFPRATQTGDDSCSPREEAYVHRVSYFLRKQDDLDVFCYDIAGEARDLWKVHVAPHLSVADVFVLFLGPVLRKASGQWKEFKTWHDTRRKRARLLVVRMRTCVDLSALGKKHPLPEPVFTVTDLCNEDLHNAHKCAEQIYCSIPRVKKPFWLDGLPLGYIFEYEKKIIDAFAVEGGRSFEPVRSPADTRKRDLRKPSVLAGGGLVRWPSLEDNRETCSWGTPLSKEENGEYRDGKVVIVDPRGVYHGEPENNGACLKELQVHSQKAGPREESESTCLKNLHLHFPEAGPREELAYPRKKEAGMTIGVVVSGGIAPGINAVIGGIVDRHRQYCAGAEDRVALSKKLPTPRYRLRIRLFEHGFIGIAEGQRKDVSIGVSGGPDSAKDILSELQRAKSAGGSVLSTARHDDLLEGKPGRRGLLEKVLSNLTDKPKHPHEPDCRVDVLYVIGGEGSMRAAHALAERARLTQKPLSVVCIPKTMDNDILWVWQSFGFLSAVEKAREFFTQLETEVRSNPRLCIMQLFGSDSGFVVSHTALAGGSGCLAALIPESDFSLNKLSEYVRSKLKQRDHGILVLAETAMPVDVEDYVEDSVVALTPREKSAVRSFVGSALLREEEVEPDGWNALISKMRATSRDLSVEGLGSLAGTFNAQETAFLEGLAGRKKIREQDQSRVVAILNAALCRNADAWARVPGSGSLELFAPPLKQAIKNVESYVRGAAGSIRESAMDHLRALNTVMCLPYEAHAIITRRDGKTEPSEVLFKQLAKRLKETYSRLVAETHLGVPKRRWTEHRERRVFGQTPDELRTAGLKIISRVLEREIQAERRLGRADRKAGFWGKYPLRVFASEPRHLIRAIGPSCHDVIFGDRMGRLAVDGAMAGYRDFMISQWLTEFVLVPLPLVVLGRKRVPSDGIFWKSVVASTGQPDNLWY